MTRDRVRVGGRLTCGSSYDAMVIVEAQDLNPRDLPAAACTGVCGGHEVLLSGDQQPGRLGGPPRFAGADLIVAVSR